MLAGGSIEKLPKILGHYSVVMTERYAHLLPYLFPAADLDTIALDLSPGGDVRPHNEGAEGAAIGQSLASRPAGPATTSDHGHNTGAAL